MLLLLLCILVHTVLVVIFKLFIRYEVNSFAAIVFNYWICMILGSALLGHIPLLTYGTHTSWVPFALGFGFIFVFGFNVAALSVRYAGIAVTTIMQKLSLLISASYAILCFSESLNQYKAIGLALSVVAIFLVNRKNGGAGTLKADWRSLVYPFLILLLSAVIEIVLYYVQRTGLSLDADAELTTYGFSVAAVCGALILVGMYGLDRLKFQWKDVAGGVVLGLPNFFSIYLILILLGHGFEGSVLFPMLNISVMVLASGIALLGFREKLSVVNITGIVAALAAIVLISMK